MHSSVDVSTGQAGLECKGGSSRSALSGKKVVIVGTNDLHGRVERVSALKSYVSAIRQSIGFKRVLVLDAGDMFQGTLASNLGEGSAVVRAYNNLGYTAAAIGNHEFDYGPVGPEATVPKGSAVDPRGALKARAKEAHFPFLAANVIDRNTNTPVAWENVRPSVLVDADGVSVGLVGVTTESTPRTTIPLNVEGLSIAPIVPTIVREATALRQKGADAVVVMAHAGGSCSKLNDPTDRASCSLDEEIVRVAEELPKGLVDVIVGGHTHSAMAHYINGIAIIESYAHGRAFGRVDLTFEAAATATGGPQCGVRLLSQIHPPQDLCASKVNEIEECRGNYAGRTIAPDAELLSLVASDLARADSVKSQSIGARSRDTLLVNYGAESALGNMLSDMLLKAVPSADVALVNGGGIRTDLRAGELTIGALYEVFPFDNYIAKVQLSGAQLRDVLRNNLTSKNGILSISGVRVEARCDGPTTHVTIRRSDGRLIGDSERLTIATSDFVVLGGDAVFAKLGALETEMDSTLVRDAIAASLKATGTVRASDYFDDTRPRWAYWGSRPATCPR